MATSRAQRTGIWIIAIAMIAGTIISFVVMILTSKDQQQQQAALAKYNQEYAAYQKKLDAQTKALSKKYYAAFKPYEKVPAKFDAKSVTKLAAKDLRVGTGKTVTDSSALACYYILWLPDGKINQQSIADGSLSAPISIDKLSTASLITGWKKGLVGMKLGGVREISVPSSLGYKDQAQTDENGNVTIPADTPLKFIVMAIPKPADIPQPQVTQEVLDAYSAQQQ